MLAHAQMNRRLEGEHEPDEFEALLFLYEVAKETDTTPEFCPHTPDSFMIRHFDHLDAEETNEAYMSLASKGWVIHWQEGG
jgi:hypothetical protein